MRVSPAAVFLSAEDVTSFRESLRALNGEFDFDSPAMIALGTTYFQKHPDRSQNRDMDAVRLGYELVRICAVEKMVQTIPERRRELYRTALSDAASIGESADRLLESVGPAVLAEDHARLNASLDDIKSTINEIPKGMVKERFVGGITALHNMLYVFKLKIRSATG